jgi:hypothetical protein
MVEVAFDHPEGFVGQRHGRAQLGSESELNSNRTDGTALDRNCAVVDQNRALSQNRSTARFRRPLARGAPFILLNEN